MSNGTMRAGKPFAEDGCTIKITSRVSIFDYDRYRERMRGEKDFDGKTPVMSRNWDWPGNRGIIKITPDEIHRSNAESNNPKDPENKPIVPLPGLTANYHEKWGDLNNGDTIKIESQLWTGEHKTRGKLQAVKFKHDGKPAFAWIIYDGVKKFDYTPPKIESGPRVYKIDFALNGLPPGISKLIWPDFVVHIRLHSDYASSGESFRLYSTEKHSDGSRIYDCTLTGDDRDRSVDGQIKLKFRKAPIDAKFNLEVSNGSDRYDAFRDLPFHGITVSVPDNHKVWNLLS